MAKAKQGLIRGMGTHRRTEGDYMAALLDTVTLEDWRDVVAGALQLAKGGDAQARAWLAQYLVGKASASAGQSVERQRPIGRAAGTPVDSKREIPGAGWKRCARGRYSGCHHDRTSAQIAKRGNHCKASTRAGLR